jgi:hypothetical protein
MDDVKKSDFPIVFFEILPDMLINGIVHPVGLHCLMIYNLASKLLVRHLGFSPSK